MSIVNVMKKSIFHQSNSIPVVKFSDIVISCTLTNTGDVYCNTQVELESTPASPRCLQCYRWYQHHM